MKAAKEVMIRKRAESKQWAPNTVAACLPALQLMENKYQKLTAIQALLELWVSNDTEAMMPWLDKVKALECWERPISQAGQAITLRKQIEVKIFDGEVCGATIPQHMHISIVSLPDPHSFGPPPSPHKGNANIRRKQWNMHMPCVVWRQRSGFGHIANDVGEAASMATYGPRP